LCYSNQIDDNISAILILESRLYRHYSRWRGSIYTVQDHKIRPNIYLAGTTIVAIRTPSEILVGADSKMTAVSDKLDDAHAGLTCKIIQIDNLFFAPAGLLQDTWGTFSVASIVGKARQVGGTIQDTANLFESMLLRPLTGILDQLRREHPIYYQQKLEGKPAVQVLFFGFEKDIPIFCTRYFTTVSSPDGTISNRVDRLDCPGNDCPTGMTYAFLGEHDALDQFLDENQHYSRNGWVTTINKLIEIEAAAEPNFVSLPIDILRIDKNGAQWIQRKAECPEIRN
jgi:hypothetical protein